MLLHVCKLTYFFLMILWKFDARESLERREKCRVTGCTSGPSSVLRKILAACPVRGMRLMEVDQDAVCLLRKEKYKSLVVPLNIIYHLVSSEL